MSGIALALVFVASQATADEYYDPVVRFKRELEALRSSRAEVQAEIDEVAAAIRRDAPGFYKAHEADCEKKAARPDGSFDFVYRPAREWVASKKRFAAAIAEKERELLAAYEEAIERLTALERRLLNRWQCWGDAVGRLKAVDQNLRAGEEEWRKTMLMAGWDFADEFVPAMKEGLGGLGHRMTRPAPGSFWTRLSDESRLKLHHRIELLEKSSGALNHAAKALFSGVDAAKEKDATEAGKKTVDAGTELSELFADILKETAIGTTKAQQAEFAQARAAVSAFVAVVRAGSVLAAGGKLDEPAKVELSNAGISIIKFAGAFNPVVKAATLAYGVPAAALETGIAASAWWTVWSAERTNGDNLDWARRMTAAAREDQEAVSARLQAYRGEKAALLKGN